MIGSLPAGKGRGPMRCGAASLDRCMGSHGFYLKSARGSKGGIKI